MHIPGYNGCSVGHADPPQRLVVGVVHVSPGRAATATAATLASTSAAAPASASASSRHCSWGIK